MSLESPSGLRSSSVSPRTDPSSSATWRGARSPAGGAGAGRRGDRGRGALALAGRFAPALAAGSTLAALAAFQADRAAAAETSFLALWVTAALLPAAALAPLPGWETRLGAPLAVLAAFALPAGPARLAAVGALLVAVVAVAAGRALARATAGSNRGLAAMGGSAAEVPGGGGEENRRPEDEAAASARSGELARPRSGRWRGLARLAPQGGLILPLALAAQVLLRSELLLAPDGRAVALLIVLPVLGALALGRLAALGGLRTALIAGAAAVTLGPGFTIVTTLALAGVAGGAELAACLAGRRWSAFAAGAAGAVLLAGLAVETRASAAALAAGAVLAVAAPSRGRTSRRRLSLPVAAAFSAALALPAVAWAVAVRSPAGALALLAWLPLLVPSLMLSPLRPSSRWTPWMAALGLGAAAALAVPGPAALAAAAAVLAVLVAAPPGAAALGEGSIRGSQPPDGGAHEVTLSWVVTGEPSQNVPGAVPAVQAPWSASLLAGTALLASPPWLRPAPADGALGLIGLEPGWLAAGAVLVAALGVAAVGLAGRGRRWRDRLVRRPVSWAAGTLVLAALIALPAPGRPAFEGPAVVLDATRPRMAVELAGERSPEAVAIYTHLSNGLGLPAGSEVATVSLLDPAGRSLARWPLRAGLDTAEWAVRRPDVAAVLPERAAPPPWAVWVQAGSTPGVPERPFFGQYYRAPWELDETAKTVPAARLLVERAAGLPDQVSITVHRIEVAG